MVLMKSRHPGVRRRPKKPGSTEAGNPVRVLIADPEQGFRRYLRRILERQPDLKVVGEAADGEEVVRVAHQLEPDVVLVDIDLRGTDAFDATQRIKARLPGTKVMMLSVLEGEVYRKAAAKHGADAFLLKTAEISQFLPVIRRGRRGKAASGDH